MDFARDERTELLLAELNDFMDTWVYPAEPAFAHRGGEALHFERPQAMAELKHEARRRGLWNLFLPHSEQGAGLSVVQYAQLAEVTGRSPLIAPEALNCAAPDTGNMELLEMFGSDEQKSKWLEPLLEGSLRSAYCMTEPDVASSDASNIGTVMEPLPGGGYRINGRKWWSTGVMSEDCKLLIVMGVSDPDADRHSRHSILLVPRDTAGVRVLRPLSVLGHWDETHGGHGEVVFEDVVVGPEALLGQQGNGFGLAQARLGPGRIHHCMRLIGMAERAFDMLCRRANQRVAFGQPLSKNAVVLETVAEARVRIEQLRALVLRTAWLIDTVGAKGAAMEISAIKIAAPPTAQWVIDKAIQVHGAGGLTEDYPLAMLFGQARGLRFADGPEEVHRMALGRRELRRYSEAAPTP